MRFLELAIPPPIVLITALTAAWGLAHITPVFSFSYQTECATLVLCIGLSFDLMALLRFGAARTTINPLRPTSTSQLVTGGIYRFSRNPMYVGLVCILLAWCLYLGTPVGLGIIPGFILYLHIFQILPEERILTDIFDEQFRTYSASVRRWL